MECRDCPYGKVDFDRRMAWYNKIVEERGIPNDIYGHETYEDAVKDAEQFLWCDKVGGKVYCFGHCTDAYSDTSKHKSYSPKKKRDKRERDLKYKNRLKSLVEKTSNNLPSAIYVNEKRIKVYEYTKYSKPYYKRIYRRKRSKYLKRQSNKAIRRYNGELHNGWMCHKLFDFWWEYN